MPLHLGPAVCPLRVRSPEAVMTSHDTEFSSLRARRRFRLLACHILLLGVAAHCACGRHRIPLATAPLESLATALAP